MPRFLDRLPPDLEDGEAIIKRREKAAKRKSKWRSLYRDCFRYAMPLRENFDWNEQGEFKNDLLYDSTLQESTYTAANTLVANVFPAWQRWGELVPGSAVFSNKKLIVEKLQEITQIFFDYLDNSNFHSVSNEAALDLMVGTTALRFDEGPDDDNPFVFSATPLAAIELEEGPNGTIETTFMLRKPHARNLTRMYPSMEQFDLPIGLQECIVTKPDEEVEIIQGCIYHPDTKRYYGVVVWAKNKQIIWRYDYGESSPDIVARAFKVGGELYGRGRVTLALSDARTLDKMQEFVLRQSALQIAPPMTGVSDGVLNPYTAVLAPNTVLPVASNDQRNPSLRPIELGGNFQISAEIMNHLRERVRRTMLGPEPSEGPVKSASEINIADRNRLWAMGGEYGRIQSELLVKIMVRGVHILQNRGLAPKFKVDGREVAARFKSPFARSQDAEDLMALDRTIATLAPLEGVLQLGLKTADLTEWVSQKAGLDQKIVNDEGERRKLQEDAAAAAAAMGAEMQAQGELK